MDRLESLNLKKDTTLAFMLEAQQRGYSVFATYPHLLTIENNRDKDSVANIRITTSAQKVNLHIQAEKTIAWEVVEEKTIYLDSMDIVFMRQDPPLDLRYLNTTYILDIVQAHGVKVVNNPTSVRSANEKLMAYFFKDCGPPSLVSTQKSLFKAFLQKWQDIIIKPLDGMGGQGIFRVKLGDQNLDSIIETLSSNGLTHLMAQKYLPEIVDGDKRILIINGKPISHSLARIPQAGELRGNLAAGGSGVAKPLTERDRWLCAQVGPKLVEAGLTFVGLDVIGDYITEINVTSPTCVRELDAQLNMNISGLLFDQLECL